MYMHDVLYASGLPSDLLLINTKSLTYTQEDTDGGDYDLVVYFIWLRSTPSIREERKQQRVRKRWRKYKDRDERERQI